MKRFALILISGLLAATMLIACSRQIDAQAALDTALDDAGAVESDLVSQTTELCEDSGGDYYRVVFSTDELECTYEVAADDGSVIYKDIIDLMADAVENADATDGTAPDSSASDSAASSESASSDSVSSDGITKAKAIKIALKDAGLTESEVTGLHANRDYDDGILCYDVSFYEGTIEYDYEITVETGQVRDKEIDYD